MPWRIVHWGRSHCYAPGVAFLGQPRQSVFPSLLCTSLSRLSPLFYLPSGLCRRIKQQTSSSVVACFVVSFSRFLGCGFLNKITTSTFRFSFLPLPLPLCMPNVQHAVNYTVEATWLESHIDIADICSCVSLALPLSLSSRERQRERERERQSF